MYYSLKIDDRVNRSLVIWIDWAPELFDEKSKSRQLELLMQNVFLWRKLWNILCTYAVVPMYSLHVVRNLVNANSLFRIFWTHRLCIVIMCSPTILSRRHKTFSPPNGSIPQNPSQRPIHAHAVVTFARGSISPSRPRALVRCISFSPEQRPPRVQLRSLSEISRAHSGFPRKGWREG